MYSKENFQKLIANIANNSEWINNEKEVIKIFKKIYGDDFSGRHMYSDIFAFLNVQGLLKEKTLNKFNINLNKLFELYSNHKNKKFSKKVIKLYDHINLEISRFSQIKVLFEHQFKNIGITKEIINLLKIMDSNYDKTFSNLESKLNEKSLKIYSDVKNNIDKLSETYDNKITKERVNIVGILSAVFSLSTIIGINVSVVQGYLNNKITISLYSFLETLALSNLILFLLLGYIFILIKYLFISESEEKRKKEFNWLQIFHFVMLIGFVISVLY